MHFLSLFPCFFPSSFPSFCLLFFISPTPCLLFDHLFLFLSLFLSFFFQCVSSEQVPERRTEQGEERCGPFAPVLNELDAGPIFSVLFWPSGEVAAGLRSACGLKVVFTHRGCGRRQQHRPYQNTTWRIQNCCSGIQECHPFTIYRCDLIVFPIRLIKTTELANSRLLRPVFCLVFVVAVWLGCCSPGLLQPWSAGWPGCRLL